MLCVGFGAGEKTMCTLVGENLTEGLIVSRLYTHSRVHLTVAVKEALTDQPRVSSLTNRGIGPAPYFVCS